MKSTKLLEADNEIISKALRVLDSMAMEIRRGNEIDADDICSLLSFLRDFADGCHHVKKRSHLFPCLDAGRHAARFRTAPTHESGT